MMVNLVTTEELLRSGFIEKRITPSSCKITADVLKENGLIKEVD